MDGLFFCCLPSTNIAEHIVEDCVVSERDYFAAKDVTLCMIKY